jgi:hypothetical protein
VRKLNNEEMLITFHLSVFRFRKRTAISQFVLELEKRNERQHGEDSGWWKTSFNLASGLL